MKFTILIFIVGCIFPAEMIGKFHDCIEFVVLFKFCPFMVMENSKFSFIRQNDVYGSEKKMKEKRKLQKSLSFADANALKEQWKRKEKLYHF